ncbi:hypothetical protein [Puniceibacterium sediminis]|uniref:Uncharacterized protein n=1 Tax=Puniceibacterium sediminis TaxID=1608407 RepID=A0A238VL73_9RHOB|nr:hypothetical protein [Puniceibacterium sediminis]SNR34867.1 hypothetical protein SAMN06265370_102317 [Puniceibacterium sediminis]
MFFGRRKKWNGQVATFLPTFGLDIETVGHMAALEALDLVYPKGFSAEEGSLYLAYLSYSTFVKEHDQRAVDLKERITHAENTWIASGRVNPTNVIAWQDKARSWEQDLLK